MPLGHGINVSEQLRGIRVDDDGHTLVSPIATGVLTLAYEAAPGQHINTQRWTYTVPAGVLAVLDAIRIGLSMTAAAEDTVAYIRITRSGGGPWVLAALYSSPTERLELIQSYQLLLRPGDNIDGWTLDSTPAIDMIHVTAFLHTINL
jgi:hypothetical protein